MAGLDLVLRVSALLFLLASPCACFFFNDIAVVSPVDKLVFVGEILKVNCMLMSGAGNISSSELYITTSRIISSSELYITTSSPSPQWIVPKENTTVIDNKTISAWFEVTDAYPAYTTITCRTNSTYLNSKGLYVEHPIQNVTNFSGMYFNDNQSIVTTWSLGEKYLNKVEVIVDWNPNSAPNMSGNVCNSATNELCVINYLGQDKIIFRIKVSVSGQRPTEEYLEPLYGTEATSFHTFTPLDSLKTGPLPSLTVVDISSTCVNISWENPAYFNSVTDDPIYRLQLKMEDETEFTVVQGNISIPKSTKFYEVCELIPYTRYVLGMLIKAREINPWSEPATTEFFTEEDRPLTGPPLNDTSYYTKDCVKNERTLFLYWNDPPKASVRGQLTLFEVVSNNKSQLVRASNNFYTTTLDCDTTYEILIYSVTKVGRSITPSQITIPKQNEEIVVEKDLIFRVEDISDLSGERSMVNISVTWVPKGLTVNTTLTLYMCQETYFPNTCLYDLQIIPMNVNQRNMFLYNIPVTTNLFGYSLRDTGQKRGIRWTNCVYRADLQPHQAEVPVVSTGSLANSLVISWTPKECSKSTKVLIIQYYIYICSKEVKNLAVDGGEWCSRVVISDMSISTYTATDLKPGRYFVYMIAESPAGLGPQSNRATVDTTQPRRDPETIVGAVLGSVFTLVVFISLVLFVARYCGNAKRRVKKLTERPEWLTKDKKEVPTYDQDRESGFCTNSTPNSSVGRTSEELDPSRLLQDASQPASPELTARHNFAAEETRSIAENESFLGKTVESITSAIPKAEVTSPSAGLNSMPLPDYIRSATPKGENSNPSAEMNGMPDYIRSATPKGENSNASAEMNGMPDYIRSATPKGESSNASAEMNKMNNVPLPDYLKSAAPKGESINPDSSFKSPPISYCITFCLDGALDNSHSSSPASANQSSHGTGRSMDGTDNSLGQGNYIHQVYDPNVSATTEDRSPSTGLRSNDERDVKVAGETRAFTVDASHLGQEPQVLILIGQARSQGPAVGNIRMDADPIGSSQSLSDQSDSPANHIGYVTRSSQSLSDQSDSPANHIGYVTRSSQSLSNQSDSPANHIGYVTRSSQSLSNQSDSPANHVGYVTRSSQSLSDQSDSPANHVGYVTRSSQSLSDQSDSPANHVGYVTRSSQSLSDQSDSLANHVGYVTLNSLQPSLESLCENEPSGSLRDSTNVSELSV